jgi:anti-sigma regulatory factor (Ser/Thr protein kinase)
MVWVGNFKALQSALRKPPLPDSALEVHTWVRSEINLISPLVDWLVHLITGSQCVRGNEEFVELALREVLSNAMLHGNRLDARKLVHLRCCCEYSKGVFIAVRDQGHGFDPNRVRNPLAVENLGAEHGRGLHLMKLAMDEVCFERGGTEVHMRKDSGNGQKTPARRIQSRVVRGLVRRPVPGVRVVELRERPCRAPDRLLAIWKQPASCGNLTQTRMHP